MSDVSVQNRLDVRNTELVLVAGNTARLTFVIENRGGGPRDLTDIVVKFAAKTNLRHTAYVWDKTADLGDDPKLGVAVVTLDADDLATPMDYIVAELYAQIPVPDTDPVEYTRLTLRQLEVSVVRSAV